MNKPEPLPQWMSYATPFTSEVWLAFVVTVLLSLWFTFFYSRMFPGLEDGSSSGRVILLMASLVDSSVPQTTKIK